MKTKSGYTWIVLAILMFTLTLSAAPPPPPPLPIGWVITQRPGSCLYVSEYTCGGILLEAQRASRFYAGLVGGLPNWHHEMSRDNGAGFVQEIDRYSTISNPPDMLPYLMPDGTFSYNSTQSDPGSLSVVETAQMIMLTVKPPADVKSAQIRVVVPVQVTDLKTGLVVTNTTLAKTLYYPTDFASVGSGVYLKDFALPVSNLAGENRQIKLKPGSVISWGVNNIVINPP